MLNPRAFKKAGFILVLLTILSAFVTSRLGLYGYVRLALLTF